MQARSIQQTFEAPFTYPVHFCRDLFAPDNPLLYEICGSGGSIAPHRALLFVDQGLAEANPALVEQVAQYADHYPALAWVKAPHVVPGGEAIKNDYRLTMEIVDTILEYKLCRHSYVIAVGGGAVLDAVGFATSIVHRGLRLIRVPSTTLAQNDAGIGVKNGMNLHGGKNTIGTFHPPFAVLNDVDLLDSLPQEHWIGGVSEAFKVAMIKDAAYFDQLCADADRYRARDADAQERMIYRCAELHLNHIRENGDPFELGRARPLDFGHWAAHKLESMSAYRIPHGEAVAIGLAIDSLYAAQHGWLDTSDAERLIDGLERTGFVLQHPELRQRLGDGQLTLLNGLDDFREHLGGQLTITYPDGLGQRQERHEVDRALVTHCVEQLLQRKARQLSH